jgi:hypothetical protein
MNFQNIILDLQRAGFSQDYIAKLCGCVQGTISAIALGKTTNPTFSVGFELQKLHRRHCRNGKCRDTEKGINAYKDADRCREGDL